MIIAPRGAGWTCITTTEKTFNIISQLMKTADLESISERSRANTRWSSLRKKVAQGRRLPREFR